MSHIPDAGQMRYQIKLRVSRVDTLFIVQTHENTIRKEYQTLLTLRLKLFKSLVTLCNFYLMFTYYSP